jgi:hypothetical protein
MAKDGKREKKVTSHASSKTEERTRVESCIQSLCRAIVSVPNRSSLVSLRDVVEKKKEKKKE